MLRHVELLECCFLHHSGSRGFVKQNDFLPKSVHRLEQRILCCFHMERHPPSEFNTEWLLWKHGLFTIHGLRVMERTLPIAEIVALCVADFPLLWNHCCNVMTEVNHKNISMRLCLHNICEHQNEWINDSPHAFSKDAIFTFTGWENVYEWVVEWLVLKCH